MVISDPFLITKLFKVPYYYKPTLDAYSDLKRKEANVDLHINPL